MTTNINWGPSPDPDDPPGTIAGQLIYSTNANAAYARGRRRRLHLHHVRHTPASDGACRVCLMRWPCRTPFKQAEITWDWHRPIDPRPAEAAAVQDEVAIAARDFLADFLGDEDPGSDAGADWFAALAGHVASLQASDRRLAAAALYVGPLFADESSRIEAVIYPNGSAARFVALTPWGGDFDAYLVRFVDALGRDWATWQAVVEQDGQAARWPAEGLVLHDTRLWQGV